VSANAAAQFVIQKAPRIFFLFVDANRNIRDVRGMDRLGVGLFLLPPTSSPFPMTTRLAPLLAIALFCVLPAAGQSPSQWQQHVDYDMDIRLNTETHHVDGHQRLTYTNNSPDTLRTVYYHLYFNAFHPESMFAERHRHLPDPDGRTVPRIFNLEPDEQGWHEIESLTQDGESVSYEVDETTALGSACAAAISNTCRASASIFGAASRSRADFFTRFGESVARTRFAFLIAFFATTSYSEGVSATAP